LLDAARFQNPSKSTLAHDAVAAAVLHKHHPIIRVGAGLIHFVYGSRSLLANGGYLSRNAFSQFSIFALVTCRVHDESLYCGAHFVNLLFCSTNSSGTKRYGHPLLFCTAAGMFPSCETAAYQSLVMLPNRWCVPMANARARDNGIP
jgi:hypothetical protein